MQARYSKAVYCPGDYDDRFGNDDDDDWMMTAMITCVFLVCRTETEHCRPRVYSPHVVLGHGRPMFEWQLATAFCDGSSCSGWVTRCRRCSNKQRTGTGAVATTGSLRWLPQCMSVDVEVEGLRDAIVPAHIDFTCGPLRSILHRSLLQKFSGARNGDFLQQRAHLKLTG